MIKFAQIIYKYENRLDRESAYEVLSGKIEEAQEESRQEEYRKMQDKAAPQRSSRSEKSTIEKVVNSTTTRQIGNTIAREITRGLLGVLGIKTSTSRRSKKKTGWW